MKSKFSFGSIILILLGAILIFAGVMEVKLLLRSSNTPTLYSVSELQSGAKVDNLYGVLDEHYALYDSLIYRTRVPKDGSQPKPDQFVQDMWYPILAEKPEADSDKKDFRIIAKVSHGYRINTLPTGTQLIDRSEGMFIDGIHSLRDDERAFLKQEFPNKNFDEVLLFQVGRERSPTTKLVILLGGGLALILIPLFGKDKRKQQNRPS